MKKEDLWREVLKVSPEKLKTSKKLKQAFEYYCKIATSKDITTKAKKIIGLALSFKDEDLQSDSINMLRNDILIDSIEPCVKEIRKTMFNNEFPPFDTIEEAVEWIRIKSKEPIPDEYKKMKDNTKKLHEEFLRLSKNGGVLGGVNEVNKVLTFPSTSSSKEWVEAIKVKHKDLRQLADKIDSISKATRFPKHAVTMFILTGIEPVVPLYSIKVSQESNELPNGEQLHKKQVFITINTTDLTFEHMQSIYKNYRKELNFSRKKSIKDKQLTLYRLVMDMGGAPEKDIKKFWINAMEEWNSNHPEDKYTTWEGVYRAFKGIKDKI
ncbi:hypothetical protein RBH29_08570 [Herbivorax sp. ANBcel31]|uniref:hypothetical protein n=1 Tax=Herbivorax sp. ANBcel31 TaxID=3069754 RepID=UPI0027B5B1A1|nr:hypothetical protein [Herbivorax sp. ANBcel31]MDQ2086479.1 hypothetical protein [Herbivorax sp. ANBcel31]